MEWMIHLEYEFPTIRLRKRRKKVSLFQCQNVQVIFKSFVWFEMQLGWKFYRNLPILANDITLNTAELLKIRRQKLYTERLHVVDFQLPNSKNSLDTRRQHKSRVNASQFSFLLMPSYHTKICSHEPLMKQEKLFLELKWRIHHLSSTVQQAQQLQSRTEIDMKCT